MKNKITRLSVAFIMTLFGLMGIATSDAQARTYYGSASNRCATSYRAPVSYQRPVAVCAPRMFVARPVSVFPGIACYGAGYGYPYGNCYGNQAYAWQQAENLRILQERQAVLCAERQELQGDEIGLRQTEGCLSNLLASRDIPYDGCAVTAAINRANCLSAQGCPGQGIALIQQERNQLDQEIAQLGNPGYPGQPYGGQYQLGG